MKFEHLAKKKKERILLMDKHGCKNFHPEKVKKGQTWPGRVINGSSLGQKSWERGNSGPGHERPEQNAKKTELKEGAKRQGRWSREKKNQRPA